MEHEKLMQGYSEPITPSVPNYNILSTRLQNNYYIKFINYL